MATRRFRIKAVANVSVSRGRCNEKPRETEKLDEKTSSNSSTTSDSQEVSPRETLSTESSSTSTLEEKLFGGSSLNEALENIVGEHSVQNSANDSEPAFLEASVSDRSVSVNTCHLPQHSAYPDVQESNNCDGKDASIGNRTEEDITVSTGEQCIKTEEDGLKSEESMDSVKSQDSCAISAEKSDAGGAKISPAPLRLQRKRMKPTVSLSLVNRKAKDNPPIEIIQQRTASKNDKSTVQILKKLETSEATSDLHKAVETGSCGMNIPAGDYGTLRSNVLGDVQKKKHPVIVPQSCVEGSVSETDVYVPEMINKIACDVISVDTPIGEPCTGAVTVSTPDPQAPVSSDSPGTGAVGLSTPTSQGPVSSDSPTAGKDKGTTPSVKSTANQSVKDSNQLNSFRSRFIRPKPLLESAARRNRTSSIGSASESDSEKKSVSSATTVTPPWQPRLKTSRPRLTQRQVSETDKLANASGASADESEDDHSSSISGAATISPPKKVVRLDSDGGSDTSHSEFSQEVSEERSSPIKKTYAKSERAMKRKEYLRRIIEIKEEILQKVSDGKVNKSRLTMFDLIYYNPVTNPMKPVQEPDGKKSGPAPTNATESEKRLAEESVDEPEALEDEERSSTVPVPQVKVGPNGEIILDEQSLVIETTDAKKNWNDLQNSEVIMDYGTGTTTFNAYSKKRKSKTKDWNREETLRFYRALHTVGTDFLVMQSLFPKFTRKDLKDRYKKEEKMNRALVEKALRNPLTFDLTDLQKEFEVERLEEERRLTLPKKIEKPNRKGIRRSCSLFAALDSTDKGKVRSEGNNVAKRKMKVKPVKRKLDKLTELEETHNEKKIKADSTTAQETHCEKKIKADGIRAQETHSKRKIKADGTRVQETHREKKIKADSTRDQETHREKKIKANSKKAQETHFEKKRKAESTRTPGTPREKKRKRDNARAPSGCTLDSAANNALNKHVDNESSVPEATCLTNQLKPTRSGRIPRPRVFEDFMTDNMEEIYEETETCDHVSVENIHDSKPVGDAKPSEQEESLASENAMGGEDEMSAYESDDDDQNFVIAEDALTVQESQVSLGSVYSNVKPGTLIVLATESPDNPGHQIFRVFMVSNNSETLPVSVTNNQASPTDTTNSVEVPVASENSTNDCNSPQIKAENSS